MAMGAAHFGMFDAAADAREPRELAAIGRGTTWLNSPGLTPSLLAGKVVLVDFWTYTCINSIRTFPYRRAWARKYSPGLVMIGVHTPEFAIEKNVENVRRAVQQMHIDYPVVIDSDASIWRAFNNQYWPALHFVDARGRVGRHHFGEGDYSSSEKEIQRLLADSGVARVDQSIVSVEAHGVEVAADWANLKSPENYLGYGRTENFGSPGGTQSDRRHVYTVPKRLTLNQWALVGDWAMGKEATFLSGPTGRVVNRFHARDLHLVMGSQRPGVSVRFRVLIDGQPPGPAHGGDVDENGHGVVIDPRLYQLVRASKPIVDRECEIEFLEPGVEILAFTFG